MTRIAELPNCTSVMPAKAGIHVFPRRRVPTEVVDARLRRHDNHAGANHMVRLV